jgi:hypothetical protein
MCWRRTSTPSPGLGLWLHLSTTTAACWTKREGKVEPLRWLKLQHFWFGYGAYKSQRTVMTTISCCRVIVPLQYIRMLLTDTPLWLLILKSGMDCIQKCKFSITILSLQAHCWLQSLGAAGCSRGGQPVHERIPARVTADVIWLCVLEIVLEFVFVLHDLLLVYMNL